jgi:hypothetical protein
MKISRYLVRSTDLAAITQHAERLLALQQLFEVTAPPGLAQHCRVANFKQGVLVVLAANALLAAKLRQGIPSLIDEFSNRGWQVTAIQVGVQDRPPAAPPVTYATPLGPEARAQLAAFAQIAGDEKLRDAVKNLLEQSAVTDATAAGGGAKAGTKAKKQP